MDLSKLSTEDLQALLAGNVSAVSTTGLQLLVGGASPQKPQERSLGEAFKDLGASALVGTGAIASLPGQLYGAVTGDVDNASTRLGKAISDTGESMKSDELKFKQEQLRAQAAEAAKNGVIDEFLTTLKGTATDPALLTALIAESAPNLIPGLAIGRGASALARGAATSRGLSQEAAEKVGLAAGTATTKASGAVLEGGGAFEDTYREALDLLAEQGVTGPEAEQIALSQARKAGAGVAAATGAVAFLPGTGGLEKILVGGGAKGAIRTGAGEFAQCVAEGATTTIPSNLALQDIDPTIDTFRGTGSAAAAEAVGGGVAGGALGLLSREPKDPSQAGTPQTPDLDAVEQNRVALRQRKEQDAQLEENVKQEKRAKEGEKLLKQEEKAALQEETARSKQVQEVLKEQDVAKRAERMEALQAAFPTDYSDVTNYAALVQERAAIESLPPSPERKKIVEGMTARIRQLSAEQDAPPAQVQATPTEVVTPEQQARRQQAQEGFDGVGQQEMFPLPREAVVAEQVQTEQAPEPTRAAAPVPETVLTREKLIDMGFPKRSVIVKRYADTDLANADVQMAIAADMQRARENTRMNQDAVNTLANTVQAARRETDAGAQPSLTQYDEPEVTLTKAEEPKVRKQFKPREFMQESLQKPSKLDTNTFTADDVITEADIARITPNPQVFGASNMPKLRELILGKTPKEVATALAADTSPGNALKGMFKGTAIFDRLVQPFMEKQNAQKSVDVPSGRSTPVNKPDPANVRPDGTGQGSAGQGVDEPTGPSVGVRGSDPVVDGRRSTVRDEALANEWDDLYGMPDVAYADLDDTLKTRFKEAVDEGYASAAVADEIAASARKNKRVESEAKLVEPPVQATEVEAPVVQKRKRRTPEEIVADQQAKAAAKAQREKDKAENQERLQKEKEAQTRAAQMAQEEKRAKKQEDEDVDRLIQAAANAKKKAPAAPAAEPVKPNDTTQLEAEYKKTNDDAAIYFRELEDAKNGRKQARERVAQKDLSPEQRTQAEEDLRYAIKTVQFQQRQYNKAAKQSTETGLKLTRARKESAPTPAEKPAKPTKVEKKAVQEKPVKAEEPIRTAEERAPESWKSFEDKGAPAWDTLNKKQQKQWVDAVKEERIDLFTANKIVTGSNTKPAKDDPDAPLYSKRGANPVEGMDPDKVQEIVDGVQEAYPNRPPVVVVKRQADISPQMLKKYFKDITESKGFYNFEDGKIYIMPDNLVGETDVVLTFVHELVGHYGLRAVLGDQYSMIMNAAKKNAVIKQEMGNDAVTERNIEEAFARLSELGVNGKLPKPILPFMTRVVAAVKNYLRGIGVNVALSNQEVYALLADARAYTKTGARKGKGEAPQPDTKPIMQRTEREGTAQEDLDAMKDAAGSIDPVRRTETSTREAMEQVAKKVLTPTRSTLEFRVKAVDRSASVVDKIARLYGTKLQDSLGNLNPIPLLRQAEAANRLMEAVFEKGGAAFDAASNLFKAVEVKVTNPTSSLEVGTPASVKGMFQTIKEFSKARNLSLADAEGYIHRVFEGRRYKWMKSENAKTQAAAAKMKGPEADKYLEDNMMVLPTNIDVDAMIAQSDKAFKDEEYVRQYDDIMRAVREHAVQEAMDAGVLSKEQGEQWMKATEYVPFTRLDENSDQKAVNMVARGLTSFSNIRKLVGSENKPIGNISDNFANTIGWLTSQTLRNKAANQIMFELEAQDFARKMKGPRDFTNNNAVVRILEGGKEAFYEVADPLDVNAFASLPLTLGPGMKLMQNSTRFLRASVTLMPQFAISQVIQDAQRAAFHSGAKNPFKVMASTLVNFPVVLAVEALGPNHSFVRGIKAMQRKANQIQALKDTGVVGQYDSNPLNPAENIRYDTGLERRSAFNKFIKAAETFTTASDMAARLAVFEQLQKDFPNDAVRPQAASRELINFNRRGSSSVVGYLITSIPFFNAYMQSMDLMYRNFKSGVDTGSGLSKGEMRAHMVKTATMMTVIGLAYAMMMQDDEEYKKTPDVIKDRNWILPGGIAIPMPPELGVFFKVLPERMVQYYQRSGTPEEQEASEAVGSAFKSIFNAYSSPNPTPQVAKPLLEAWTNYSLFTGRPIVPQSMQDVEPWLQFGSETSTFAMEVGKMFNVSPLMVDQVVSSTFGMAGTTAVQLVDAMTTDRGDRPLYRYPLVSTFVKSPEGSQFVNEFYDFREKTARVKKTFDRLVETDPDEAMAYLDKGNNAELYTYDKYVNKVLKELSEIRKYRKFVQGTDTMTGEEKRREIDAMDALRNEMIADIREIKAGIGKP